MINSAVKNNPVEKVLIFSPNWLGDTVISTALVSSIKKEFPSSSIVIAANKYVYPLWEANPLVDEVLRCEVRGASYIISYIKFLLKLKKYRFDLAIILPHCFRYALFSFCAGIPLRTAYNVGQRKVLLTHPLGCNLSLRDEHLLDNYLAILGAVGIKSRSRELVLGITKENKVKADNFLEDHQINQGDLVIGIGPGAVYGAAKRWPKENYARVIEALIKERGAKIFVFTGSGEKMLIDWLKENVRHAAVTFLDNFPLGVVLGLIKKCGLFIGNDSGLAHIASAFNIRTITLFGSTSPRWTAPRGENNVLLYQHLSCSPCFERRCKFGHYACLNSITVEEVMDAVKKVSGLG